MTKMSSIVSRATRLVTVTGAALSMAAGAGFVAADAPSRDVASKGWVADFTGKPPFERSLQVSAERASGLAVAPGNTRVPGKQGWTLRSAQPETVAFARFEESAAESPDERRLRGAPGKNFIGRL